jgi:hypothetical protein
MNMTLVRPGHTSMCGQVRFVVPERRDFVEVRNEPPVPDQFNPRSSILC